MKKMLAVFLFSLSFQLLANCEISTAKKYSYLNEEFNKDTICREFTHELLSMFDSVEIQNIKIEVQDVEKFRVNYQFNVLTSHGELTGSGTHFWFPGDSFAKISLQ